MGGCRLQLYTIFATLLLLLSACGPAPRQRVAETLTDVESYINERPDSALTVLRSVDAAALRRPSLRARHALLHTMALDKNYIDLQTDSILAPAVAWYGRHGTPDEKLKTLYYLGRLQYNAKDYQQAIVTYTEALELTGEAKDLKYVGFVNQAIADTYSVTYQEKESLPYLDRAYELFLQIPDTSLAKRTLYKNALALSAQKRWHEADSLFVYLLTNESAIEQIIPRIKADYALEQLIQKDNGEKVYQLFESAIQLDGGLPSANHWGAYAYSLSRENQTDRAKALFAQLISLFPDDLRVLFWRHRAEYDNGEYKAAYLSLQQAESYQNSVLMAQMNQSSIVAQKEYFENKSLLEKQALERNRYLFWLTVVTLILLIILGYLFVRNNISKARSEQIRLSQTIDVVNRQLELMQKGKVLQEQEKEQWKQQYNRLFGDYFNTLGKICADYEEGKLDRGDATDRAMLRRIDKIVHSFTGDKNSHAEFEEILNKHLDNIMRDFRQDFPKMAQKDYLLASYIFAGIEMPVISVLMGDEVEPLYTRKSRIKSAIRKADKPVEDKYVPFFHK